MLRSTLVKRMASHTPVDVQHLSCLVQKLFPVPLDYIKNVNCQAETVDCILMFDVYWWYRSAFFCFCNDERPKVRAKFPSYSVGDVAKELGKRWEVCTTKPKYEQLAAKDRQRYEKVSESIFN